MIAAGPDGPWSLESPMNYDITGITGTIAYETIGIVQGYMYHCKMDMATDNMVDYTRYKTHLKSR